MSILLLLLYEPDHNPDQGQHGNDPGQLISNASRALIQYLIRSL